MISPGRKGYRFVCLLSVVLDLRIQGGSVTLGASDQSLVLVATPIGLPFGPRVEPLVHIMRGFHQGMA